MLSAKCQVPSASSSLLLYYSKELFASQLSQGIYISVPFCRTKCSFCNFASGVFSRALFDRYVAQVCAEIEAADDVARQLGGKLDRRVDSIYLGGGTPSVLAPDQLRRLFQAVRENFELEPTTEITVECAPGTIPGEVIDALLGCGVNRVSLGVQSFVDKESSSVGRLHTRAITLDDIARLRSSGIGNISVDLIAGLPHQTEESWQLSLSETLASGVPHVSVYMLEVDEDSRLGTERPGAPCDGYRRLGNYTRGRAHLAHGDPIPRFARHARGVRRVLGWRSQERRVGKECR